jgi:hypothetical protein
VEGPDPGGDDFGGERLPSRIVCEISVSFFCMYAENGRRVVACLLDLCGSFCSVPLTGDCSALDLNTRGE